MLKKSCVILVVASFLIVSGNVYASQFVPGKPSNWYNEWEDLIAYEIDPTTNYIRIQYVADKDWPCIKDNHGNVKINWKIKTGQAAWNWMYNKGLIAKDNFGNVYQPENQIKWRYMHERKLLYWQDLSDKRCLDAITPVPPPSPVNTTKQPTIEYHPNGTMRLMIRYYVNGNPENEKTWDNKGNLISDTSYYNDGNERLIKVYWTSSGGKIAKVYEYPCSGCKVNLTCYNQDGSRRKYNCKP